MLPARLALNNGIHSTAQKKGRPMRNVAIAATILVGGGFVAYQVYSSDYLIRQRRKIEKVIDAFFGLSDAVSTGGDLAVTVVQDLQKFLQSDTDEVPRSIRQLIKLGSSPGVCDAVASLAGAVTVGIVGGVGGNDSSASQVIAGHESTPQRLTNGYRGEVPAAGDVEMERGHDATSQDRTSESLVETVMDKMFSEKGKGFAAEIVGSVARNLVATYFDKMQAAESVGGQDNAWLQEVLDLACADKGKSFVMDCIATFVGHATHIYLDKTAGINFYDDLVSSVTKESAKEPLKDILTSVCNGAVDTFVRTSHEVMTTGSQAPREDESAADYSCDSPLGESSMRVHPRSATPMVIDRPSEQAGEEGTQNMEICEKMNVASNGTDVMTGARGFASPELSLMTGARGFTSPELSLGRGQLAAASGSGRFALVPLSPVYPAREPAGGAAAPAPGWMNEMVKVMAVPDNRQLLTDVVGTMSAQATRAFVGACFDSVRGGKGKPWRLKNGDVEQDEHEECRTEADWSMGSAGRIARVMAGKALITSTICLALCLHVLGGSEIMQTDG